MKDIFYGASAFNQDLSKWDVSTVTDMRTMFADASSFNQDLSNWDVSKVTDMEEMFLRASSFNRELRGIAWGHSKAVKTDMFKESPGSIPTVCTRDTPAFQPQSTKELQDAVHRMAFRPQSKSELQHAVDECIKMSPIGDCSKGPHGPIGDWDVSSITDMKDIFYGASAFNQDLSKWDVSTVTDMRTMFADASSFNQDLSNWDVSKVTDMEEMFLRASAFNRELRGIAWGHSKAVKTDMFKDSPGSIPTVCTRDTPAFRPQSKSEIQHAVVECIKMSPIGDCSERPHGSIGDWDVSAVTDMKDMFNGASAFNQDLSNWDVAAATDMNSMFYDAS